MRVPRALARAMARAKPAIPEGLWPVLLTARSVIGDGPLVGLPAFRRVVVLSAHPDDESLGCGGTMALLADAGAEVSLVIATDGEATRGSALPGDETGRLRREEAERAGRILGARTRLLGHPDGALAGRVDHLARDLASVLDELRPEALFLPWFLDGHPDHQALSDALALVPSLPDALEVWGYETWTALVPNRVVDITSVIDRKREALAAHETAALAFDLSAGLGLSRWRSVHGLLGRGHGEAFLALPVARYLALTAAARTGVRPEW
ncbi:MAG: PIG-L deacetylase family protein [Acidimicrobiales bacterium]